MRVIRGLLGALLWIIWTVLMLVAIVLCVTVILLPLGIPLFKLARRLIDKAILLMLPRPIADPAGSLKRGSKKARKKGRKKGRKATKSMEKSRKRLGKKARSLTE